MLVAPASASAKTYTVNRTGDPAPGACTKIHCTLREAVIAANATPTVDDLVLLEGGKRYEMTRNLTDNEAQGGDLDILDRVEIRSDSSALATVDINELDRVFHLVNSAAPTQPGLDLKRVRVTGGSRGGLSPAGDGGGINVTHGALTLFNSRVSANAAAAKGGGIFIAGTASPFAFLVDGSTVSGNSAFDGGGGLYTERGGTVLDSTISGNSGGGLGGGGISYADAAALNSLTIDSSTVSGNETTSNLANQGRGGGLLAKGTGNVNVRVSTFAGNESQNGGAVVIADPSAQMSIYDSTIARNDADPDGGDSAGAQSGGLVVGAGNFAIRNSILANNTYATPDVARDCFYSSGTFQSFGTDPNVVAAPGTCAAEFVSDSLIFAPAKLDTLASNGGPTKTIAIKKTSPARNAAGPNASLRDQRGVNRGDNPDIGAYER